MDTPKCTVATALGRRLNAIDNCIKSGNTEWRIRHSQAAEWMVKHYLPSGSGIDNGVKLDFIKSTERKLVFRTSFHHMRCEPSSNGVNRLSFGSSL